MYINQPLAMSAERRANVPASAKHSRSSRNEGRDQTNREKSKKKSKPEKYATNGRKYLKKKNKVAICTKLNH